MVYKKLKGKTVVVTGSTSGIGESIASCFAKQGCNVVLNGFASQEQIRNQINNLKKLADIEVIYSDADMTQPNQIKNMIAQIVEKLGTIDILVNNAGIQHVNSIEDFPDNKWNDIIAINLSAAFHTIKHSIKYMKQNKWGRIINIASAHGLVASPNKAGYVAAKHGIIGLTKVVALENAGNGITVNAICPGWVLTPLVQAQIERISEKEKISTKEAELKLLSEKQPSCQFIKPEEIGEFAVNLCSESSSQITGAALSIDGGWTAR